MMDADPLSQPEPRDYLEPFRVSVHQILNRVNQCLVQLEKQVTEVEQFYESTDNIQGNNSKGGSLVKEKGREKHPTGTKKPMQDASHTEAAAAKRMQELMRQFSTILRQITQHKWAWPFLDPVDVEGLKLHDYYEEKRQLDEEAQAQLDIQLAQETTYANKAKDISTELYEVDMQLKSLKEMVIQKCRKLSTQEKKMLGVTLGKLSLENLYRALDVVAETNPIFQPTGDEVDLDLDAQSDYTLWRLKAFVKDALEEQEKIDEGAAVNPNDNPDDKRNKKRRDSGDSSGKTNPKRKKLSAL
ncbi:transcription factor GTE1-like isoform X3 [Vigna umbellata]|uniref:transcription factor GTE1-like isoform X3 n=1 Tax=Vigna umbellata TaxID=87088 RepID=UPI001F5FBFAD|nr:transcription factor GTE1-like isoform X3 [Vigna umbellata]